MPRKKTKQLQNLSESAVKIRCRYCDIRNECSHRETKESYENAGWMTRCSLTPNRPGKKKSNK